jgi:membrane protein
MDPGAAPPRNVSAPPVTAAAPGDALLPHNPAVRLSTLKRIAVAAANGWVDHRASSRGAALALYTLFSLAPILFLVTTIAGLFFGQHLVRQQIVDQVRMLVGDQGANAVVSLLSTSHQRSAGEIAAWISFGILMVSATTAFSELKDSLDELWELPPSSGNSIWIWIRERLISFGVLLVLALLLLISLAVSAILGALDKLWGAYWTQSVTAEVATVSTEIIGFAVIVALFATIYKMLPNTPIAWRDVLPGALLTAVLFTIGKAMIGYYLGHGGVSSAYGAAGSFIALVLWVYYSSQIFFYGALLTYEWTFTLGSRRGLPRQKARLDYVQVEPSKADLEASGLLHPPQGGASD